MNQQQLIRAGVLAVLGLVLVFVLYRQFFGGAAGPAQVADAGAATQSAAPGGPSAGAPAAPPAAGQSQFRRAAVNLDELIASIQDVQFDYDAERTMANPMTPLVGPWAPSRLAVTTGDESEAPLATRMGTRTAIQNMRLTGIIYNERDPMAVVTYPFQGELVNEVVTRGYEFAGMGVRVNDIERDRILLNVDGVLVPIELQER